MSKPSRIHNTYISKTLNYTKEQLNKNNQYIFKTACTSKNKINTMLDKINIAIPSLASIVLHIIFFHLLSAAAVLQLVQSSFATLVNLFSLSPSNEFLVLSFHSFLHTTLPVQKGIQGCVANLSHYKE